MHVVEESLDVKHEGSAVQAAAVRNMEIMEEGETSVQRARESMGAELGGGDKAVGVNVVEKTLGHGLLKELAEALQEGDRVVVLGSRVIVTARFGDDDDQGGLPRGGVVIYPHTSVGEGGEVVLCSGPSHLEDAPSLAREARGGRAGGLLKVAFQLIGREGVELPCGARGRVVGLMKAHIARVVDEETGSKESGNALSIEDQGAIGVLQRRDGR